jgi:hypothetical protein
MIYPWADVNCLGHKKVKVDISKCSTTSVMSPESSNYTRIIFSRTLSVLSGSLKAAPFTSWRHLSALFGTTAKVCVRSQNAQIAHYKEILATLEKCKLMNADVAKIGELKLNIRINALSCRDMKFACFDGVAEAQCCEGVLGFG